MLSLDTFERRTVTSPAAPAVDTDPMFSPDGRTIAFVRSRSFGLGDLYLVPAGGGSPTRLTFDDTHFVGALAWTPNGTSIIFAADRAGLRGCGESPWQAAGSSDYRSAASHPAIPRSMRPVVGWRTSNSTT